MKKFLKFTSLTIATIGLFISLADALGWIPNPRDKLVDQITSLGDDVLPLDTKNVNSFLKHFLKKKYTTYKKQANELAGIVIEDLRINASVMGTVYIEHKNGGRHQLCNFQQLSEWADSGKMTFWIGWGIAVTGLVCAWIIEIIDNDIISKSCICPTNELEVINKEDTGINKEYKEDEVPRQSMDDVASGS